MLNPIHLLPIQSFHQDWIAGTLLCLAAVVVSAVARDASPGIPRIALPLLALAALALLHAATGLAPTTEVARWVALGLLCAALASWIGATAAAALGRERVIVWITTALALAAWANSLVAVAEARALASLPVLLPHQRPDGIINQANHLADVATLGLIAAGHLWTLGRIRVPLALVLGLPMLAALQVSGSKMGLLFLLAAASTAALQAFIYRAQPARRLALFLGGALPVFLLVGWALVVSGLATRTANLRLRPEDPGFADSFTLRVTALQDAFRIFFDHPLLGAGIGSFQWHAYADPRAGLALEHAHNLVAHLAAETGLIGLAIVLYGLITWAVRNRAAARTRAGLPVLPWLTVLLVHSLMEYPLWHLPYLLLFALIAGLAEPARGVEAFHARLRWVPAVVGLFGLAVAVSAYRDFSELRSLITAAVPESAPQAAADRQSERLARLERGLFRPWAQAIVVGAIPVNDERLDAKIAFVQRVLEFKPFAEPACHQLMLHALRGGMAEAAAKLDLFRAHHAPRLADCVTEVERIPTEREAAVLAPLLSALRQAANEAQSPLP